MAMLLVYFDKIRQRIYKHVGGEYEYEYPLIYIWTTDGRSYGVKTKRTSSISGHIITITWTGIDDSSNAYTIDRIEVVTYMGIHGGKIVIKPDQPISKDVTEILEVKFTLEVA